MALYDDLGQIRTITYGRRQDADKTTGVVSQKFLDSFDLSFWTARWGGHTRLPQAEQRSPAGHAWWRGPHLPRHSHFRRRTRRSGADGAVTQGRAARVRARPGRRADAARPGAGPATDLRTGPGHVVHADFERPKEGLGCRPGWPPCQRTCVQVQSGAAAADPRQRVPSW